MRDRGCQAAGVQGAAIFRRGPFGSFPYPRLPGPRSSTAGFGLAVGVRRFLKPSRGSKTAMFAAFQSAHGVDSRPSVVVSGLKGCLLG